MKFLTVCVLSWAMMALTRAAEEKAKDVQTESSDLVKRYLFCRRGWTRINGGCFQYVPKLLTWAKAERNCQSMDAHLASVQSNYEYNEIQKLTAPHGYKGTWIGGSDAQEETNWFWADGEKFFYTHWCRGEPNNLKGSQHCLQINHTGKKCWGDVGCKVRRPSICAQRGWGFLGGHGH